jgi:hypothetical protein
MTHQQWLEKTMFNLEKRRLWGGRRVFARLGGEHGYYWVKEKAGSFDVVPMSGWSGVSCGING